MYWNSSISMVLLTTFVKGHVPFIFAKFGIDIDELGLVTCHLQNKSLCTYYRRYYGKVKELSRQSLSDLFWIANGAIKMKEQDETIIYRICWNPACTFFIVRKIFTNTLLHEKIFIRKWAPKTQNLKKMLRESPTSNVWCTIFKNTDFSWSSLKLAKLS